MLQALNLFALKPRIFEVVLAYMLKISITWIVVGCGFGGAGLVGAACVCCGACGGGVAFGWACGAWVCWGASACLVAGASCFGYLFKRYFNYFYFTAEEAAVVAFPSESISTKLAPTSTFEPWGAKILLITPLNSDLSST